MSEKQKFCKMLDRAIKDEREAPVEYTHMLESILKMIEKTDANTPIEVLNNLGEASTTISAISNQEFQHHDKLINIKRAICEA